MLISRLICVALLIALALKAGQFAISDYYFEQAKQRRQALNIDVEKTSRVLLPILREVEKALYWRPNSAEALDLKADVLYQSWWLSPDGQYFNSSKLLQAADATHRKALNIRKDWSFVIARLALIHAQKPAIDAEFETWFAKAYQLGRYETEIARSMMQIGLQAWPRLNPQQRQQTIEFTRISIEQKANSSKFIRALLSDYEQLDFICNELPRSKRMKKVCQSSNVDEAA